MGRGLTVGRSAEKIEREIESVALEDRKQRQKGKKYF